MAFVHMITAFAIVSALACSTMAKDIVVGDQESGWKLNFDYQDWAKEKEFLVGDRLIFNYPQGAHNVYKVDGDGFKTCTYPEGSNALTSGKDVITLASAGQKWYICGVANHCNKGMKLIINVKQKEGSSYPNSAAAVAPRGLHHQYIAWTWMIASFVVFVMIN